MTITRHWQKTQTMFFLMAYDQYTSSTKPGPIGGQKWIEKHLVFSILLRWYQEQLVRSELTEASDTLKQFLKQRFRWTFGVLQTFWKNRDAIFNVSFRNLGFIALPDILLFKYIIPLFSPFADLLMLLGLLTGSAGEIGFYYSIFLAVDMILAVLAYSAKNYLALAIDMDIS
ncbi:MAG: hypothetical protein RI983_1654 [Bacteroidota bacterium]|jgi:cellulose synthase/poly-beta-1,6-N-acetylglucosamine synthase-like glycosyltransferase